MHGEQTSACRAGQPQPNSGWTAGGRNNIEHVRSRQPGTHFPQTVIAVPPAVGHAVVPGMFAFVPDAKRSSSSESDEAGLSRLAMRKLRLGIWAERNSTLRKGASPGPTWNDIRVVEAIARAAPHCKQRRAESAGSAQSAVRVTVQVVATNENCPENKPTPSRATSVASGLLAAVGCKRQAYYLCRPPARLGICNSAQREHALQEQVTRHANKQQRGSTVEEARQREAGGACGTTTQNAVIAPVHILGDDRPKRRRDREFHVRVQLCSRRRERG
jgi:hypothetical protein